MADPPSTVDIGTDITETAPGFQLEVTAGPAAGARLTAVSDAVVVGSHDEADLVIADPAVSRFHCRIAIEEGRMMITDLDSRNGTRVDGVRVRRAALRAGAVVGLGTSSLVVHADQPRRVPASQRDRFGLLLGRSLAMRRVFAVLERVAASDVTLLLLGETGTGKEAAAESIHQESPRAAGPLVVVDCSAIPPDLLESELFGHERGAFTGADRARAGAFAAAAGGTLFLDEIGELALALQPKLLRALETREIKPVGGTRHVPVDVRVIAATHRDLAADVNARRFRADLYYRVAVVKVRLPALRERLQDLDLLIARFLEGEPDASAEERARLTSPENLAELQQHGWPGNVRELRNYVQRMLAVGPEAGGQPVTSTEIDVGRPLPAAREAWVAAQERRYAEVLLERAGGNVSTAARAAGVDRASFYRLLWKHGIK